MSTGNLVSRIKLQQILLAELLVKDINSCQFSLINICYSIYLDVETKMNSGYFHTTSGGRIFREKLAIRFVYLSEIVHILDVNSAFYYVFHCSTSCFNYGFDILEYSASLSLNVAVDFFAGFWHDRQLA